LDLKRLSIDPFPPEAALIVKHPSSKTAAKGVILEEALEPGADRIFSKLQALSNRSE
jgi:hypothetical protein